MVGPAYYAGGGVAGKDGGDADRHCDGDHRAAEVQRVGRDASDKPFGGLNRAVMVEMVEDEAELVAHHAGKDVRRTDESAQDLRCVDERRIAGQASVAVVDRLQVIEPDLAQCRRRRSDEHTFELPALMRHSYAV